MSTEVRVKTRVIQKHGTSSDWNQATNFVPLQGEIIVYDDLKKFKIGDGTTSVIDLPFSALGTETITAGKGLTGGGTSSTVTLNVGAGTGITVADDAVNLDLTYYATAESAGLMSATDKAKLDGIAAEANKYTLPTASSSALGGVQLGYSATGANIPVQLSNDKAYVALTKSAVTSALGLTPTANIGDITGVTAGNGLTGGATSGTATLNVGAGSGITVSADAVAVNTTYTTTGKNYAVAVDTTSGGLYVTVPWTDTNTDTHYTTGINAGGTGATANAAVSNPYITIKDNSTYRGQIQLKGSGATSISSDANGVITIKSTDNNTTYSAATTSAAGLMSAADKTKLDGIATGADAVSLSRSLTSGTKIGTITINGTGTDLYCQTNTDTCNTAGSHEKSDKLFLVGCLSQGPYYETFSNSKCYASGGYLYSNGTKVLTSHQSLDNYSTLANTIKSLSISGKTITYTKGDGTTGTLTTQDTNTTYNAATQSAAGLMSANDKKKLDGIAANANNYTYTLPNASSSTLGGVKVGSNITVSSGTISLTKANVTAALGYTPPTSDTNTTYSAGTGIILSGTTFSLNSGYYATSKNSGLMSAADKAKLDGIAAGATALTLGTTATTAAKGNHTHNYLPLSGGNVTGHIYLTGAQADSSTANTSQLVFGTSSDNHVCISSNNNALIINPSTTATLNQIVLYLDQPSSFPSGIAGHLYGNASSASVASALTTSSKGSATNPVYFSGGVPVACTYSLGASVPSGAKFTDTTYSSGTGIIIRGTTINLNAGYYATSKNSGLMSASDKSKLDGIAAGATALSLGNTATTAAKGNHTHSTISNAFTVAAPTATTPNYPLQIKYNNNLIFKVRYDGTTYADKGYYSTGADYAEYFEWLDANSLGEDRRGLFAAMSDIDNSKIELAQNSDNIVGIVSANPSMVGNDAEMHWSKKYLTDVFGSYIMEEVTHPATVDQNGKLIPEYTTYEPKLNPEYNPDLEYIPRSQRKEWAVIGLLGQLVVCDDGSCWPGGYCKCGANGVATVSAEPGWRVLARLDENHIRILFK